jgi:CheY-like chemotaxis protein
LTANAMASEQEQYLAAEMTDCVTKPIRPAAAQNKNIENNPMHSSRRRPQPAVQDLDLSGKSAAQVQHPGIRWTSACATTWMVACFALPFGRRRLIAISIA